MSDKMKILVVDDEPNILKSVKRLFIGAEYKILTAESAKEGLEVINNERIEIVISDYRMPDMNGVEFLKTIKELYPDTLRIILSGYADVSAIVEAINEGNIYKFISKPWNDQEFLTTILRAKEQLALLRENRELYHKLEIRNAELQKLAESLEGQVQARTRALEMRNRALLISQNILNLLPIGVIGIDSAGILVYSNDALEHYIQLKHAAMGLPAKGAVDDDIYEHMMTALREGKPGCMEVNTELSGLMAIPLPNGAGVIGLFALCGNKQYNYLKYCEFLKKAGPKDVREISTYDSGSR